MPKLYNFSVLLKSNNCHIYFYRKIQKNVDVYMNKYLIPFIIFFLAANNVAAQNDPTFTRDQLATLADDIGVKAEQLCEYIVDVGSTNSGVSDEEKDEIIKYRLSPLFWNYAERFMKTTGGAYGTTLRTIARF